MAESRNRYSVGCEFIVNAESPEEAQSIVSNFADGFPSEVEGRDADLIVQDATMVEENVAEEGA